jgi:phage protein D
VPAAAKPHVAGVVLDIDGQPASEKLMSGLTELRVEDNLMVADACTMRVLTHEADMKLKELNLEIGKRLVVKMQAPEESAAAVTIFDGDIVALEPDFSPRDTSVIVRAYDRSHRLNRQRKTRVFQDVTYDDVAKKIAGEGGLSPQVDSAPGGVHKFLQQSTETDWEFLWRLAGRIGFEVYVTAEKLFFRKIGSGGDDEVTLKLGENLVAFRPRLTGAQQVKTVEVRGWDAKAKQAVVGTAGSAEPMSTAGNGRGAVQKAFSSGDDKVTIGNSPVTTADEAKAMAESVLAKLADTYVEAQGDAIGHPKLRAGNVVKIEGCGEQFSGKYKLSATTHVYSAAQGYHTKFRITGRTQRTLLDLMTPSKHQDKKWANGLVIGVVTNNSDPDKQARVRIKYPSLDDQAEGWWARVAGINAGKDRGVLMLPQVGDEVLIGFEHNDPNRPFVLGSLWNGKDTPGELEQADGSFELRSKEKIEIKAEKDILVDGKAKITTKAGAEILIDGQSVTIKGAGTISVEATGSLTPKGMGVTVDGGGGVVQVKGSQIMLG